MSNDKGFRSMGALVDALRKAEEGLRCGALPLHALEQAADDARDLYERLIVLRHKARESAYGKPAKAAPQEGSEVPKPQPPLPAPAASTGAKPAPVAPDPPAGAAIRLQTNPAPAPQQAEDAPVMKTAAEFLREAKAAPSTAKTAESVAERLERARIADLAKAISLSDKFWFIKELFGGDAKAYEVGLSMINNAKDLGEAKRFLHEDLLAKLKTQPDPEALEAFNELVERRFA